MPTEAKEPPRRSRPRSEESGVRRDVSDPLGRPVDASWLLLADGRAVVEAAAAIGLPLLERASGIRCIASSRGFGELVLAALESTPRPSCSRWEGSRPSTEEPGLARSSTELPVPPIVLCDVQTRLGDAARLFGPQKGASDGRHRDPHEAAAAMEELRPYAELPGAGAAGGLGAALAGTRRGARSGCAERARPARVRRAAPGQRSRRHGRGAGRRHDLRGKGSR